MKKRKGSHKGSLVEGFIPPISRKFLGVEFLRKEIRNMLEGNVGLYVLYKDKKLYYVGITDRDLFWRLHQHTRDKHKNKWDSFSVFIINRGKYLKDIESMAQYISSPPANIWKGRFKEHYKYGDRIKNILKDISKIINEVKK
jgi:hypothetical protein